MKYFTEMSTNVLSLLFFSGLSLIVYYSITKKFRKYFLLLISVIFYAICDIKMLAGVLATTMLTWFCAKMIEKKHSVTWLVGGCVYVIALLGFFKYNNFFIFSINSFLEKIGIGGGEIVKLAMPLGISYYAFKSISYMYDVFRNKYESEKDFSKYALYVFFFCEILSGPISRYSDFKKSIDEGMNYSDEKIRLGFYFILRGLFMKGVIANRLADYVSTVFANPDGFSWIALWMAAFFYAIQLYCDFGGYSSLAIGITQLFGLHYQENFIRPYFSTNIIEFWNRWHISLSSWLKDYIYIPLGGSRCSKLRRKINVMIVFLVSGLWHGSGLNFVIWGAYHGVLNILTPRNIVCKHKIKSFLMTCLNFLLVTFGWIFFGSPTLGKAVSFLKGMFVGLSFSVNDIQAAILPFTNDNTCVAFFLTVLLFIAMLGCRELYEERKRLKSTHIASNVWQVFLLTSIILFGEFSASGFIYANF